MRLGVKHAFVDGELVNGDVEISDGRIAAVGLPPGASGIAAPGFIDLQINGFVGVDFTTATLDDHAAVALAVARTGVTTYLPTLICVPESSAIGALATLADFQRHPSRVVRVPGMHLEGPFLSTARSGAHDPANVVEPSVDLADRLLSAGPVAMITVAPERPGAIDLIRYLADRVTVVSCGHSDATASEAESAFAAGATCVTHLFNAQRPFTHRDPGLSGAALGHDSVTVTIIVDGLHLDPATVRMTLNAARGRTALITDAISATGRPEGIHDLGDRTVHVSASGARLEDGTLAGSVLTMDTAVRNLIDLGADLTTSIAAATVVPARVLGSPELGTLAPGTPADVVVLDDDMEPVRTLVAGLTVAG